MCLKKTLKSLLNKKVLSVTNFAYSENLFPQMNVYM